MFRISRVHSFSIPFRQCGQATSSRAIEPSQHAIRRGPVLEVAAEGVRALLANAHPNGSHRNEDNTESQSDKRAGVVVVDVQR